MSFRSTFIHPQQHARANCESDFSLNLNEPTYHQRTRMSNADHPSDPLGTHLEPWNEYAWKMFSLGKTASTMIHDLNNILTTVLGYIELATMTTSALPDTQRHLQHTLVAANRGKEMIKQFQARETKDETEAVLRPIALHTQITEALTFLHPTVPSSIKIRQTNNCAEGLILGHSLQIFRLLTNILTNAIKAMATQKTGVISIQLDEWKAENLKRNSEEGEQYIRLTIRDTGPGIPPAIHKHLFRPFFTTSKNGTGTGLGLTIVNEIVRAHHGYITVDSESGKGSTFTIFFPHYHQAREE